MGSRPGCPLPWPVSQNPALAQATAALWAWLDRHGLSTQDNARASVDSSRPDLCAALMYPTATVDTLTLIAQWWAWPFILDDQLDDWAGTGADQAGPMVTVLLASLAQEGGTGTTPIASAITDLWARTQPLMTVSQRRRFLAHLEEYIDSYRVEAVHFRGGQGTLTTLTVEEYLIHRRASVEGDVALDFCEVVLGRPLPDAVRRSARFARLTQIVNNIGGLSNDLHSWHKELDQEYPLNAVHISHRAEGGTLPDAVNRINNLLADQVTSYQTVKQDLLTLAEHDDDTQRLLTAYESTLRGFYEWHRRAPRYQER